jgi:glucose/mannose-6-phosphate isomerase
VKGPGCDSSDMLGKIGSLPQQLPLGLRIGREAWSGMPTLRPDAIVIAGMGASAIVGDLLRLYLSGKASVPVFVVRGYGLPRFVGPNSLVVVSSYSGNTEEALACFGDALGLKAAVVSITSGGALLDESARRGLPCAKIPPGFPPRAGLGWCFSALLALAWRAGLCEDPGDELGRCTRDLESLKRVYLEPQGKPNPARELAEQLVPRMPLIYCGTELDAVGLRWKNQFSENSKKLAFVSVLPEANHNDLMGFEGETDIAAGVIVLRSCDEHPGTARGLALVKDLTRGRGHFCGEFWASGSSLLCRMFSLILLGDYASVYLALARGIDPTPIATIDGIKARLRGHRTDA